MIFMGETTPSKRSLRTRIPDLRSRSRCLTKPCWFRGDRLSCSFRTVMGSLLAFGRTPGPKRCQTFGFYDARLVMASACERSNNGDGPHTSQRRRRQRVLGFEDALRPVGTRAHLTKLTYKPVHYWKQIGDCMLGLIRRNNWAGVIIRTPCASTKTISSILRPVRRRRAQLNLG